MSSHANGRSPQPSSLAPRKVVPTATDRASGGRGRCNRSRLRQTRPPPLSSRAVTVAAALASRAATRRHPLGPPLADIAWDRRSCLTTPLVSHTVGSRRRRPVAARHRSHLTLLHAPSGHETLIPRGLGYFYRRSDLVRLNRMSRLSWTSCSY